MCTLPKGILECRQEGHSRMYTFQWKSGKCRNDKNGPLQKVHFFLEKTGEPPSNVWFSRGQSALSECSLFTRELGEPPGRLHFFTMRGANFFRMCIFLDEKRGAAREGIARGLRGDREGTARDLKLEKREEERG